MDNDDGLAEEQSGLTRWAFARQLLGIVLIFLFAVLALYEGWGWLIPEPS